MIKKERGVKTTVGTYVHIKTRWNAWNYVYSPFNFDIIFFYIKVLAEWGQVHKNNDWIKNSQIKGYDVLVLWFKIIWYFPNRLKEQSTTKPLPKYKKLRF